MVAYCSDDRKTMFLVVGITENNLKILADKRDTDVLIDPKGGVEVGRERDFALSRRTKLCANENLAGVEESKSQPAKTETLPLSLWENLYGKYSKQANQRVYKHYPRMRDGKLETVFDEISRR